MVGVVSDGGGGGNMLGNQFTLLTSCNTHRKKNWNQQGSAAVNRIQEKQPQKKTEITKKAWTSATTTNATTAKSEYRCTQVSAISS